MDLATKKSFLTAQQSHINGIFTKFNTVKPYMGVYFSTSGKSYITYSSNNTTFPSTILLAKINYIFALYYTTSGNFTTQTNTFLSS